MYIHVHVNAEDTLMRATLYVVHFMIQLYMYMYTVYFVDVHLREEYCNG